MKTMSIQKAIAWAVRDELPKVGLDVGRMVSHGAPGRVASPGWASASAGAMGGLMDRGTNRYGVIPDMMAADRGEPHPDAVTIGDALLALDGVTPGGFEDWEAFDDLAGLAADPVAAPLLEQAKADARTRAGAMVRMTGALSALMVKRAVLGQPAGWDCGQVGVEVVSSDNGMPLWFRQVSRPVAWNADGETTQTEMVEVDGRNLKTRRPYPDAYRKHVLTPDPMLAVMARVEWQIWRAALDVVFEDVAGLLRGVAVEPCALPMRPWVEDMGQAARVLSGGEALPMQPARAAPVAGRSVLLMAQDEHNGRMRAERRAVAKKDERRR